jgi:DNA-binding CsgD family transcriptional regulator
VWRLTTHLTSAQREVLELRYRHDLSLEQIAERLGRSRGSVDALQHRAIATLRTRLEARIDGYGPSGGRRDPLPMRALSWPPSALRQPGFSVAR